MSEKNSKAADLTIDGVDTNVTGQSKQTYVEGTEMPERYLHIGGTVKMLKDVPAQDAQDVEVLPHITEKVKGAGHQDANIKWAGYRIKFLETGLVTYASAQACADMKLLVKTENGVAFAYSRLSAVRAPEATEATLVGA